MTERISFSGGIFHICTDFHYISPYSVMMLLSFVAGIGTMYCLNRKAGIPKNISGYLCVLAPPMILFCAVGFTYISSGGKNLGFASMGALIGMYLAVISMGLIAGDLPAFRLMMRNCTLVLPLMYGVSKFGCFLAGCCGGFPYTGTFSARYTGTDRDPVQMFPVQLVESLCFLCIFALGTVLLRRKKPYTVPAVFLLCAAAKGGLDFLRAEHAGVILSLNQLFCLLLSAVCIAVTGYLWVKQRKTAQKQTE